MNLQNSGTVCRENAKVYPLSCPRRRASSIPEAFVIEPRGCRLLHASPCGISGLRDAFQKRLFRRLHRVGGADMHPDAVEPQAEQPFLLVGAVEQLGQREFARGRQCEGTMRRFPRSVPWQQLEGRRGRTLLRGQGASDLLLMRYRATFVSC